MQDVDLFLELAGIAGIFVGFGALIAVRSTTQSPFEVSPVRGVVLTGTMSVIAALAPVTLSRYDLDGHLVWVLSSLLVVVGFTGLMFVFVRTPEYRIMAKLSRPGRTGKIQDRVEGVAFAICVLAMILISIVIWLGLAPAQEAALYFTFAVLILLMAVWALLWLVLSGPGPEAAK